MSDEKELTLYITQKEFDLLNWALLDFEQYLSNKKDFKQVSELKNTIVDQIVYNHDFEDELADDHNLQHLMTSEEQKELVKKAYFIFRRNQQQKCIDCANDAAKKQIQADLARSERGY